MLGMPHQSAQYLGRSTKKLQKQISKFNVHDIQYALAQEIQEGRQLVSRVRKSLKSIEKLKQRTLLQKLQSIQRIIREKDKSIRQIETQVSNLKNSSANLPLKYNKQHYNYKTSTISKINNHYAQLMPHQVISFVSLKTQLENGIKILDSLREQLAYKKSILSNNKHEAKQIFKGYEQKCHKQLKDVISFSRFANARQDSTTYNSKSQQKLLSAPYYNQSEKLKNSNKKMMNGEQNKKYQIVNNLMLDRSAQARQIINYKIVVQNALKNQKKKHKQEIGNFLSKLQFLKDQHNLLQQKIKTKQIQLRSAQIRFNQSRTVEQTNTYSPRINRKHGPIA